MIYVRVCSFLEKNKLLSNSQYRFISHHSCEHSITELVGHILQSKDAGLHSTALFLDLSKAFDTLNHIVLLQKLENMGDMQ